MLIISQVLLLHGKMSSLPSRHPSLLFRAEPLLDLQFVLCIHSMVMPRIDVLRGLYQLLRRISGICVRASSQIYLTEAVAV